MFKVSPPKGRKKSILKISYNLLIAIFFWIKSLLIAITNSSYRKKQHTLLFLSHHFHSLSHFSFLFQTSKPTKQGFLFLFSLSSFHFFTISHSNFFISRENFPLSFFIFLSCLQIPYNFQSWVVFIFLNNCTKRPI